MRMDERVSLFDERLKGIVSDEFRIYLINNGFFTAPASTKYHGSYEGGLFDHSFLVMKSLADMTEKNGLDWQRPESPYIVGMFHDLCKIDNYIEIIDPTDKSKSYKYNDTPMIKGHGDKSIMLLSQFLTLTEEEILCIRYHMGAFVEKEEWRDYTRAVNKYENVLWTHHADMLASHVLEV